MWRWLRSIRGRYGDRTSPPVLELVVLAGRDVGRKFTIDGDEIAVAHGAPRAGSTGAILLSDPSISPRPARIRGENGRFRIERAPDAGSPLLLNGREATSGTIAPGDRIQLGEVLLEVRQKRGTTLGGMTQALLAAETRALATRRPEEATTEVRQPADAPYQLVLVRGGRGGRRARFAVRDGTTTIGRDPDSDVRIPDDRGVSRRHAKLVLEGDVATLFHLSEVNPTLVNGDPIEDQRRLAPGDEIQLPDRVTLRFERGTSTPPDVSAPPDPGDASLRDRIEDLVQRQQQIEQEFTHQGSFLDVDVVGSYAMKAGASRAERIVLSFERWRAWVTKVVEQFDGLLLNCNGDELMCFFESTHQAVQAGSAVLEGLEAFNRDSNLLASPFRLRVGVHSGTSLVDRRAGIAYSPVLDVAGHLQKAADVDGLLVSDVALAELPDGLPFEPAGLLEPEGIQTHRLVSWLTRPGAPESSAPAAPER